jgi:hypothetical protein
LHPLQHLLNLLSALSLRSCLSFCASRWQVRYREAVVSGSVSKHSAAEADALVSQTNTAPHSEREAESSVGFLQWGLPEVNRGHRHFQEHAVPCKPALTGQNAVAMDPIVALFPCAHAISHGIDFPREPIRGPLEWSPGEWSLVTPGGSGAVVPE